MVGARPSLDPEREQDRKSPRASLQGRLISFASVQLRDAA